MRSARSRTVQTSCLVLASSSLVLVAYRALRWRARKRAKLTVERMETSQKDGPLIDYNEMRVRERILETAMRRASKWMRLFTEDKVKPMVGQVGGSSSTKKPVLTLKPDYILKPLLTDHRGIREVAFYEALKMTRNTQSGQSYVKFLNDRNNQKSPFWFRLGDMFDTLALALAMSLKDPGVVQSEKALKITWKKVKREVEALHKLAKLTPHYHGVLGQSKYDNKFDFGVANNAHILLHDLTINYSKPCVMDLKMGTHTFEPDAPPEKVERESSKYPQQVDIGFRIVGMRIFSPLDEDADNQGYRFYGKEYGRNLKTDQDLVEAFRTFFSSTTSIDDENDGDKSDVLHSKVASSMLVQLRPFRKWFDENCSLTFSASSLLIIYEGDTRRANSDAVTIKMIDFGRVRRREGGDPGYRVGLKKLNQCIAAVLDG